MQTYKAITLVYVNDLPIFAKTKSILQEVINLLESLYEEKNLSPIKQLLQIEFNFIDEEITLNRPKYILQCMNHFNVTNFINISIPLTPGTITKGNANDQV